MSAVEVIPGFSAGDVPCRGCGRTITLYENGGELDQRECCGYRYETFATGYQLVITPPAPPAPDPAESVAGPPGG